MQMNKLCNVSIFSHGTKTFVQDEYFSEGPCLIIMRNLSFAHRKTDFKSRIL